jgi:RimJ/RimL family protein N-acetyltransferase
VTDRLLFFRNDCSAPARTQVAPAAPLRGVIWRPSLAAIRPPGTTFEPKFVVWWLLHHLRIFDSRDYCIYVVYDGDRLVHRTFCHPRWWRFPFMARDDLQFSDSWTADEYRGRGLGAVAQIAMVQALCRPGRVFWGIILESNDPPQRVIRKSGFTLYGYGERRSPFGLAPLVRFSIVERLPERRAS